jgi:hypothetical protein
MAYATVSRFARLIVIGAVLTGCGGLNGIRGTLVSIEGNQYIIRDSRGEELRFLAVESTRKDDVLPGDEVRVYATKDGHAAYIQKLDGEQGGSGSAVHETHGKRRD